MSEMQRVFTPRLQKKLGFSLIYLSLIFAFLAVGIGLYQGGVHLVELEAKDITLDELPWALLLSLGRIALAYVVALMFSFITGLIAARTRWGERIIIPTLDILQSIPIVGFFPAAIMFFIGVTNGHRLGVELAAIFLIFTSQAWNMAFAVYESIKSIPQDNLDAVSGFGIKGSQRFWKLYVPICIPRLVYNSVLSWANGWFFLVACEIIAQGPVKYHLPGIGSFLARAAEQDQVMLVVWGLVALTVLILLLDFMIWRPAALWSERFKNETSSSTESSQSSWSERFYDLFIPLYAPTRRVLRAWSYPLVWTLREIITPFLWDLPIAILEYLFKRLRFFSLQPETWSRIGNSFGWAVVISIGATAGFFLGRLLLPPWPPIASEIPVAILVSTGRLLIAMFISIAWILPVVLLVWDRPRLRQGLSTIAQVGASLPAIALFPLFILVIAQNLGGGMELASILLLLTGMQWYLLFNCLGGTASIPGDLSEATRSLGIGRVQTWKKLVLPAMRPALVTGSLTAWGGGWNALVVAEYVTFKDEVLQVRGIGSLLNYSVYELGDNRAIMLCLAAMVGWILILNVTFWQPIYRFAINRYKFGS